MNFFIVLEVQDSQALLFFVVQSVSTSRTASPELSELVERNSRAVVLRAMPNCGKLFEVLPKSSHCPVGCVVGCCDMPTN